MNPAALDYLACEMKDIVGKNDFDVFSSKDASFYRRMDEYVIQQRRPKANINESIKGGSVLATKVPALDPSGKLLGTIGVAYFKEGAPSKASMKQGNKLLSAFHQSLRLNINLLLKGDNTFFILSPQEAKCIKGMAQGKTAKEPGIFLKIAPKTVQDYLSNIKKRYHCRTKDILAAYYQNKILR